MPTTTRRMPQVVEIQVHLPGAGGLFCLTKQSKQSKIDAKSAGNRLGQSANMTHLLGGKREEKQRCQVRQGNKNNGSYHNYFTLRLQRSTFLSTSPNPNYRCWYVCNDAGMSQQCCSGMQSVDLCYIINVFTEAVGTGDSSSAYVVRGNSLRP